ncbi:hypothetical protein [Shinella zoogloeoides]
MGLLKDPAGAIGAERRGPVGKPVCLDLPVDVADRAGETISGRVVPGRAAEALVGHGHSSNRAPSWSGAKVPPRPVDPTYRRLRAAHWYAARKPAGKGFSRIFTICRNAGKAHAKGKNRLSR